MPTSQLPHLVRSSFPRRKGRIRPPSATIARAVPDWILGLFTLPMISGGWMVSVTPVEPLPDGRVCGVNVTIEPCGAPEAAKLIDEGMVAPPTEAMANEIDKS